jgi:hypothetical protein
MRAIEFLVEYNRQLTQQNLGKALHAKLVKDPTIIRIFNIMGKNALATTDFDTLIEIGLERLEEVDPTPNKQYVQWIVRTYAKDPNEKLEDVVSTLPDYLDKFYKLVRRKKIPSPRNNILGYTNFGDFMSVMDEYPDPDAPQLTDKGSAFTLYEDDKWRVIVPQDEPASCYYGQGTRWCTSATKARNMFSYYNNIAPLLIAIPKDPFKPGEKYQLHFGVSIDDQPMKSESDVDDYMDQNDVDPDSDDYDDEFSSYGSDPIEYGQIMDEHDDPITITDIGRRMGASWDGMIDAYTTKFPDRKWQLLVNLSNANRDEDDYY